jgi:hypothetical protein
MVLRISFIAKLILTALILFYKQEIITYADDLNINLDKSNSATKPEISNSTISKNITPQANILLEEFSESSKIILMSIIASVCYGIIHDAITINVCFDYFRSDMTHHGPYTRRYFPFVYYSNSKILYTLLWGTIATYWVGGIAGIIWAIAARSNPRSLTWHDLIVPTVIFMSCTLACSIVAGFLEYQGSHNSFETARKMHNWSYGLGTAGALVMAVYFLYKSKSTKDLIKIENNGLSLNLASLFFTD